jgi:ATP-dependent RNA helicase DeaD
MQSFNELELSPEIRKSIQELGYTAPSPIQAQSLPKLLGKKTDFIGQAATGTGKTAAFGIPLIERIDPNIRGVQGLILCPTRELAIQVAQQIDLLGKYKGVRSVVIYGGTAYDQQIRGIKQGHAIVVGTPGRLLDHLDKGTLKLTNVKTVILDEADEMISMGFKEDLESILDKVPDESANTWLFSATMSPEVRQVAANYLVNPDHVAVNRQEVLSANVQQIFYATNESSKPEVLCKVIDAAEAFYGIVFCQTKALVVDLVKYIQGRGYKVDCLHGDMNQAARERAMASFRDREVQVLICTDVASRGLDVKDVTHVVNYSLPREMDVYVHRIGRTARSGKAGVAVSLVSPSHRGLVRRIEQVTKSRMVEGKIPGRREIALKKVSEKLSAFQSEKWHGRAIESMNQQWKDAIKDMSKEEIAGRFLSLQFGDLFADRNDSETRMDKRLGQRDEPRSSDTGSRNSRDRGDRGERGDRGDRPKRFGGGGERRFGSGRGPSQGRGAPGREYARRPRSQQSERSY